MKLGSASFGRERPWVGAWGSTYNKRNPVGFRVRLRRSTRRSEGP
ncbi:hypothetical protein DB32_003573 [Sandaracinus amylolyticus]|uniref:Uncharacterized protein n=1 Tax=Sandaracinus amylolyticus TaxID=927083 RepID=A0A0F6SF69_9BACT|nr:hypothetical protein DB32_003573 [Sandaracinus amylolyticus]